MTKDVRAMTADEALMALHDRLATGEADHATMTPEEKRAYNAEAKRRQREKERALREAGKVAVTETNMRHALADAALILLTAAGPGSTMVRDALLAAFPGMPGVALTVEQRARSGKMGLKLVDLKRLEEIRAQARKSNAERAAAEKAAQPAPSEPVPARKSAVAALADSVEKTPDSDIPAFLLRQHGLL